MEKVPAFNRRGSASVREAKPRHLADRQPLVASAHAAQVCLGRNGALHRHSHQSGVRREVRPRFTNIVACCDDGDTSEAEPLGPAPVP